MKRVLPLTLLLAWTIAPLLVLAIWSLAKGWFYPSLLPVRWSLDAWGYTFSDTSGVLGSLGLTLWIGFATTALAALIGIPAGRALGLHSFKGKGLVQLIILAPVIVPGIAVVLGLHGVFITLGLNNTTTGVILVHLIPALPYMILIMAGVFANYDAQAEDQARSLGASRAQVFRHVTLPAIAPGLMVGSLFTFLVSWSQYILTLVIGGGRIETLPLLLFNFASAGRNDITGAIAVIYILPGALILALTARHLTGGNTVVTRV